jgi:hypothetical protein
VLFDQELSSHLRTHLVWCPTPNARAESEESPDATYHFSVLLYTGIARYRNLPQQDTCAGGCHVLGLDFLSLQIRFKELPDRVMVPLGCVLFWKTTQAHPGRVFFHARLRLVVLERRKLWKQRSGLLAAVWLASTIDAQEFPVRIVELLRD